MKKLLLFICLLPLFSYAQKIPDFGFNKISINEPDKIILAEIVPISSAPKPQTNLFYYWYKANIIHATQGGFSGDLLNGKYNEYYPDKNLREQGSFKKGLKDGLWKTWSDNGILLQLYTWKNGLKSGRFALFDEQGKVKQSGRYKDDVLIPNDPPSFWQRINIFRKKDSLSSKPKS